jgi:hypothetical protein
MKKTSKQPKENMNSLEESLLIAGDKAMEMLAEKCRLSGKADWDPNAPETEEDAIKAEQLRRLRVRRLFKAADPSQK